MVLTTWPSLICPLDLDVRSRRQLDSPLVPWQGRGCRRWTGRTALELDITMDGDLLKTIASRT